MISVIASFGGVSVTGKKGKPPQVSPTIEYIETIINPDLTVTYYYRLTSGDPELKHCELYSPVFTSKHILTVSEHYSVNPAKKCLRINVKVPSGESKIVSITVNTQYYALSEGMIDYKLYWPSGEMRQGQVWGPIPPSELKISNQSVGVMGSLGTVLCLCLYFKRSARIT